MKINAVPHGSTTRCITKHMAGAVALDNLCDDVVSARRRCNHSCYAIRDAFEAVRGITLFWTGFPFGRNDPFPALTDRLHKEELADYISSKLYTLGESLIAPSSIGACGKPTPSYVSSKLNILRFTGFSWQAVTITVILATAKEVLYD